MKQKYRFNFIKTMIPGLIALIVMSAVILPFEGQTVRAEETKVVDESEEPVTYKELKGKKIGVQTGAILDKVIPEVVEDAKIVYYDQVSDLYTALMNGKVAAITGDEPVFRYMAAADPAFDYRKNVYINMEYGLILNKDSGGPLCEELNAFIAKCKEDGSLDKMIAGWMDSAEGDRKIPDYTSLPAKKGTIHLAVDGQMTPFDYVRDGKCVGYEVELMTRFCEEAGYALKISNMKFGALLPGVSTGKYDVGAGCIMITEERRKSVLFTDPTYTGGGTIAVRVDPSGKKQTHSKASDYAKKRIAVMTGTNFPDIVTACFPEAEQIFLNSVADNVQALKTGKVDAIAIDEPVARSIVAENKEFTIAEGYLDEFDFAFLFPKSKGGQALCDELSEFMRGMEEDGSLEKLQKKWFDSVPEESMMEFDPQKLPDTRGTLQVATLQYPPFSMMGEKSFFGYEPELLGLFAQARGYRLDFLDMNADAILPSVQSGKTDLGASATAITEERKEMVLFSEPEYSGGVVLVVKKKAAPAKPTVWKRIRENFDKTFVREHRYRLFIKGIGTTLLISVLSALFGTLIGFLIFMSCRRGNVIANKLASGFQWFMACIPVVVLLMILYYLIFGKISISGTIVAIIGFTLVFAAEVCGKLMTAVSAVDPGQMEAAYALGYTDLKAFFTHILPQAMPHFLPGYRGGLISLIKATSIVGYIAVEDLTKMGDIVRSRTYEAFFPLISVAIIYFILAGLLVLAANRLTLKFDPTRRNKEDILKGIVTDD